MCCVYFLNNNTIVFSDLQAFGDLLMHTSGNNEWYEHEFEYNKRCITQLLFVLSGLYIVDVFNCMLCPKVAPRFFYFLCMQCFVFELHWI